METSGGVKLMGDVGSSGRLDTLTSQLTDSSPSGLCEGLGFRAKTCGLCLRQHPLGKSGP